MFDPAAFGPATPPPPREGVVTPVFDEAAFGSLTDFFPVGQQWDKDGLAIPAFWWPAPDRWEKQPLPVRQKRSDSYLEDLRRSAAKAVKKKREHTPAPRFSTNYCIEWGRKQKWTLIDRENYDFRTNRHHDLELGSDAKFDSPEGVVLVQGAGRNEKEKHLKRFNERGGVAKCRSRHYRFVYVEFARGNKTPLLEEWWA